jgi:alanine-synthesizing transaminase
MREGDYRDLMFSGRSYLPPDDNEFAALRRGATRPWLDLGLVNPTEIGLKRPDYVRLVGNYDGPYQPDPLGGRSARESLSQLYWERGVRVPIEDIVLCASTSEAYGYLLMALCDPGDSIAIPQPSYPLFEHLARLQCVEVKPYRLGYDGSWFVDFDSLRRAVDERTKAIFLVSPNNPTGSFLKPPELLGLWDLGVPLVVDEVFRPYAWPSYRGAIAEPLGEPPVLTCVLDGLSKRIGAPDLKLAWMVWGGPSRQEAVRRIEWIADTFLSVASPVQRALPELLLVGRDFQQALCARVDSNLVALREAVSNSPVTLLEAEGGWYANLRFPALRDEQGWLELFLAQGLSPPPGWLFDFEQQPLFVLSLLLPEQQFRRAARELVSLGRAGEAEHP